MCAYAGIPPQGIDSDLTLAQLDTYVRAEDDRRKFYKDLVQYTVWCMKNINRPSNAAIVPIQNFDPILMMDELRKETRKEKLQTKAELSAITKDELNKRMDREAYIDHHKKQNKK